VRNVTDIPLKSPIVSDTGKCGVVVAIDFAGNTALVVWDDATDSSEWVDATTITIKGGK